jgi:hypothetical protein
MLGVFVLCGPVPQGKGDADKPLRSQRVAAPDNFFGHLGHERRCGHRPSVAVGAKAAYHQLSKRRTSHEVERNDDRSRDSLSSLHPGYGLPYRPDYPLGKREDETFEDLRLPSGVAIDRCRRAIQLRSQRIDLQRFKTIARDEL